MYNRYKSANKINVMVRSFAKIKVCIFRIRIKQALAKKKKREDRKREKERVLSKKYVNSRVTNPRNARARGTLIFEPRIFIFCFLIFNATPIETPSSVARDMKAPDAGFEFNWQTVEDRENPAELFSTKARGRVLSVVRLNVKFFPSISRDQPIPQSLKKNWKICSEHTRENLMLDEVIGGQIPLTFRK